MNIVLQNVWAAWAAVAGIFLSYYLLIYFIVVVLMKQGAPRRPRNKFARNY
ncbi:MAG: hypothetical protein RMK91_08165 [Pseudanabaenaceae cyanobacterium SKYGB_i_bin29]|nr:hypothetical protein [Pseudanabaenaceae cyanobacterium SKYG29]MDW8421829.1 hypothetical protein [Pseudanabaenaceae cyanobacterium SKYGB_i_bin29]